jgi:hypothetical protein
MPSREHVEKFVSMVEAGQFVEAMERYYLPDATAQENNDPPRIGLTVLLENERRTLTAFGRAEAKCIRPIVIDGERVVIHWVFTFTRSSGEKVRLEELAQQIWVGDRLSNERFFYDPRQLRT